MPDEYRFLVFSPSEAAAALAAYARGNDLSLPDGRITGAEPVGDRTIGGRLSVDGGAGPPSVVSFSGEQVLEALIGYCLDRGIPLPMVSEKTLERLHGRFALRIGQIDSIDFQMRTHAPRGG